MSRPYDEPDLYVDNNLLPDGYKNHVCFTGLHIKGLTGVLAGNKTYGNAVEIEIKYHYCGSGPKAFGGASYWPHVTTEVSFVAGQEKLAVEFAEKIEKFIRDFQLEHRNVMLPRENE